ncbi:unnamed protein product [Parnassius apollo]|uniref:(apollo) hypothetical protein n=2 Tax=Parnassius apollo TaxID=110799 RepID=A0A8S3WI42_PARAO|nr:unnamed protein product [Parnassius apollo]
MTLVRAHHLYTQEMSGYGYGSSKVKCEPPSDEEESNSQFTHGYLSHELSSPNLLAVKVEAIDEVKENVSSHILHHLQGTTLLDRQMQLLGTSEEDSDFVPLLPIKDEPLSEGEQLQLSDEASETSGVGVGGEGGEGEARSSPGSKGWAPRDMECALQALRDRRMSLTKASATYGIPSTTLWQRAHRLGIDTPKKDGGAKSWSDADLRAALHALRAGALSANKASKAYGIPSSTLYKIARREGIRLAAPFNAAPTSWHRSDLQHALAAIRCGAASVQRAAAQFGIPTGTLYGRCKREGIELSRSNPTPWSEDAMGEALEAVRVGQMSINQAAIHYNLPYSSLYGRFKRCKYQLQGQPVHQSKMEKNIEIDHQHQHQDQEPFSYHSLPPHADPNTSDDQTNVQIPYSQLLSEVHDTMHGHMVLQEQYSGQGLYYTQGYYSGMATS